MGDKLLLLSGLLQGLFPGAEIDLAAGENDRCHHDKERQEVNQYNLACKKPYRSIH